MSSPRLLQQHHLITTPLPCLKLIRKSGNRQLISLLSLSQFRTATSLQDRILEKSYFVFSCSDPPCLCLSPPNVCLKERERESTMGVCCPILRPWDRTRDSYLDNIPCLSDPGNHSFLFEP